MASCVERKRAERPVTVGTQSAGVPAPSILRTWLARVVTAVEADDGAGPSPVLEARVVAIVKGGRRREELN